MSGVLCVVMCASACTERSQESDPVRFAQSAGGASGADSGAATVAEAPSSQRMDTSEVDGALAMAVADPQRSRLLLISGVRWDERYHRADPADSATREHASREALRAYDALVNDHPSHDSLPEVLFRAARLEADASRMDLARRRFLVLIQRYPTSPFVPFAYLSFGDYFLGQRDYASAQQFYERVRSMSPRSELGAYTNYQLARSHWGLSRCIEALQCLQLVLAGSAQGAATASVRDAAMRDQSAIGACRGAMPPLNDAIAVEVPQPPYTAADAFESNGA